jgi:arylsulfatase A-like enzyme/Flp pilus assembly protein TadD
MSRRAARLVLAASLGTVLIACSRGGPAPAGARPNILLVTIDTFRADRIGVGVAPTVDRLAAAGLRFTAARTAVPLTLPSHATIHTGLLPPQHGVRENGVGALADTHRTLARLLKDAGYRTAAFVGAFVLDRRFGLSQGFDVYDDQIPRDPNATERLEAERPASAVIDRALAWFSASPKPQAPSPFFVWIHLYDPHAPYTPPPEFAARAKTPYDGEIAYADAHLARLLDALRARGDLDRALVVVAGDHGEGLGDHGERTHGMLLYDSTLRVPLVIVAPGGKPQTIDAPVSLAEIAPTILRAAGATPPPEMKGRDLIDRVSGSVRLQADRDPGSVRLQPDLYSETEYPRVAGWSPLQALTDGRWKTIRAGSESEVYDLEHDPAESHDVAAAQSAVSAAMAARADAIHAAAVASARTISPDAQERLRALGYVASTAQPAAGTTAVNPRTTTGDWAAFEDALAALNAHRPAAVDGLKALAAAHPDAVVFQATYARALKEAGQPIAALNVYRQAARRWPTDAVLIHDLAVTAREAASAAAGPLAESLREEAARADQAAVAIDPQSATALNGLGLLAIDAGRPADAAKSFERAAALDPNNASYWANLGNARRAGSDRAGAEQAYRRALDVDPRYADAANGLGVLLVEAQRPGEAVHWFERALSAAPDLVEARLNLGIALQQSGDVSRAADAYRAVLKTAPRDAREREAAARLLAALGERR